MRKLINKKGKINVILIFFLTFLAVFISLLVLFSLLDKGTSNAMCNDGHCPDCETEWRYVQAVGHKAETKYIWVCDRCGKSIEVNNEPDWRTVKTVVGETNDNT